MPRSSDSSIIYIPSNHPGICIIKSHGACGIITIRLFRNSPEKSFVKCRRERDVIPFETRKKPRLIKRSGDDTSILILRLEENRTLCPLPNTRGKLYTPYYHFFFFFKCLRRRTEAGSGEDAEGVAREGARRGNFIIGQSEEESASL